MKRTPCQSPQLFADLGNTPESNDPCFRTPFLPRHKETLAEFWEQGSAERGAAFFKDWFNTVARSKLESLKKAARTLKDHLLGLLNYFAHPITNALTEGFNSRIQAVKANARGFRRFAAYRARILFHCGKLDMTPDLHPLAASSTH